MKKYRCVVCEWIYDPAVGDPTEASPPERLSKRFPTTGHARLRSRPRAISKRSRSKSALRTRCGAPLWIGVRRICFFRRFAPRTDRGASGGPERATAGDRNKNRKGWIFRKSALYLSRTEKENSMSAVINNTMCCAAATCCRCCFVVTAAARGLSGEIDG